MPINIPNGLPARAVLEQENIFVMAEHRAAHQDIRPLRILILNLMPKKIETETHLLRVLSNTPLQVDIDLLQTKTHVSKNTPAEHLLKFYNVFDDVKERHYDGMIITGAPVEQLPFEQVDYWEELCTIFDWTDTHVFSTLHICWAAQAGLYYCYGIPKYPLPQKMFGVFEHRCLVPNHKLFSGFDDCFFVPHSRHTALRREDIEACGQVSLLSYSEEAGVHLVASRDNRRFFVTGHAEYDRGTLAGEYWRDRSKGLDIALPRHYFPGDDPAAAPVNRWKSHGSLLYSNWLNYFVYQNTPFDLQKLTEQERP